MMDLKLKIKELKENLLEENIAVDATVTMKKDEFVELDNKTRVLTF